MLAQTSKLLSFLPTPSARRATAHKLHEIIRIFHFYPRPPRGGRHLPEPILEPSAGFLPTPSARRATRAAPLA